MEEALIKNLAVEVSSSILWEVQIGKAVEGGCIDTALLEKSGYLSIKGWCQPEVDLREFSRKVSLQVNGTKVESFDTFRIYRPDVAAALSSENKFLGFNCYFRLPSATAGRQSQLHFSFNETPLGKLEDALHFSHPHYQLCLNSEKVLHKEDLYCVGPPCSGIVPEVLDHMSTWRGSSLDFGCGNGALVSRLVEFGIDARGIEIDRPAIRETLPDDLTQRVHLYGGEFPLPYDDNSFDYVSSIEVIEHVGDYMQALKEIARLVRKEFVMTVPDIGSIPLNFHNGLIPWHMMEASHVNFFTQRSLEKCLREVFSDVSIAKVCPMKANGTPWYVSLMAICRP